MDSDCSCSQPPPPGGAAASSDSNHQVLCRCDGRIRLALARRGEDTVPVTLYQQGALRVFRPRVAPGDIESIVTLNTSGGIVGGDRLGMEISAGSGAAALITSQAAEKAYRSLGPEAAIDVRLALSGDTWLEWLPQETILFDGARLRRQFRIGLDPKARLLAGEVLVFGRRARGERFRRGRLVDRWEVCTGGRLVWVDVLRLDMPERQIESRFGFAGAAAHVTCIYVGPDVADWLPLARQLADQPDARGGATQLGPVLLVRWLADEPTAARHALQHFYAAFRHEVRGLPASAPAMWRT